MKKISLQGFRVLGTQSKKTPSKTNLPPPPETQFHYMPLPPNEKIHTQKYIILFIENLTLLLKKRKRKSKMLEMKGWVILN